MPTSKYLYILTIILSCFALTCGDKEDPISEENMDNIAQSIKDSLILYLPFDNNGIDSADVNHLTIINDCEFNHDRHGNPLSAISFNGIDGYVDILSPLPKSPDQFTMTFWIKNLSLTSAGAYIFCLRENSYCNISMDVYELKTSFKFKRNGTDPVFSVKSDIDVNEWIHIAIIYKKQNLLELYVNNELKDRITDFNYGIFSEDTNGVVSAIGCWNDPGSESNYWKGEIDDVRVYSKILTSQELQYLFEN